MSTGGAAEEGEELVVGAGFRWDGDRRGEQRVPSGFGDEQWRDGK
jgi:hypothetical protein